MKRAILDQLKEARETLLTMPKDQLDGHAIVGWYEHYKSLFGRADQLVGRVFGPTIFLAVTPYEKIRETEVLNELMIHVVGFLDEAIPLVDSQQTIRPLLEHWTLQIQDTKLSSLLREFNMAREACPNLSAIAFRTILCLIIYERARRQDPSSTLAQRQDISFERDIKAAISSHIFSSSEERLLNRFLNGGKKDKFDIIAHKLGPTALIDKDDLEDAVDLLNSLLPTIV